MNDRKTYYDKALGWAEDRVSRESRLLRIGWTIAGVLAAIAMLEAVALALLTPLKTVQPITLLVDRQTGYVQSLDPTSPQRVRADAALTNSLLAQYVVAREGFDRATVASDYRRVALWSTGTARARYLSMMPASNPDSPFQRYAAGTSIETSIRSVSPLNQGMALVRFETREQDRAGRTAASRPWIAVVRYRFSDGAMSFEDRLVNPLGFQVVSYRRDPEAPPPAGGGHVAAGEPAPSTARAFASPPRDVMIVGRDGIIPASQVPMGSPLEPMSQRASPSR